MFPTVGLPHYTDTSWTVIMERQFITVMIVTVYFHPKPIIEDMWLVYTISSVYIVVMEMKKRMQAVMVVVFNKECPSVQPLHNYDSMWRLLIINIPIDLQVKVSIQFAVKAYVFPCTFTPALGNRSSIKPEKLSVLKPQHSFYKPIYFTCLLTMIFIQC